MMKTNIKMEGWRRGKQPLFGSKKMDGFGLKTLLCEEFHVSFLPSRPLSRSVTLSLTSCFPSSLISAHRSVPLPTVKYLRCLAAIV